MSSNRVLKALLRLYPKNERARFGPQIVQTFNDRRRELSSRGGVRRMGITAWMLWDVAHNGLAQRLAIPMETISVSLGALAGASLAGAATLSFFFYTPPESVSVGISLGGAFFGAAAAATRVSRRNVHALLGALAAMSLGTVGFMLLNAYGPWFTSDITPWYFWSQLTLALLGSCLGFARLLKGRPGILLRVMLGVWVVTIHFFMGGGLDLLIAGFVGLAYAQHVGRDTRSLPSA